MSAFLSSLCQNAQHLYKCLAMANAMKYTFHCATASPSRCRHTPESIISSHDPLNYHPRVTGCFSQYSHAVMVIGHSTVACGTGYKEQRGDWKCETWICGTNLHWWKLRDMKMRDQFAGVENAGKVSMESQSVKKCLNVVVFVCRVIPSV